MEYKLFKYDIKIMYKIKARLHGRLFPHLVQVNIYSVRPRW